MAIQTAVYPGAGVDAASAIQTAINACNAGDTWVIPTAAGSWTVARASGSGASVYGFTLKSGTAGNPIIGTINGDIIAKAGDFLGTRDSMIGCDGKAYCTINGAGSVSMANAPQTGEFRHCIQIRGADNIILDFGGGLRFTNAGGDNVYIGPSELVEMDALRTPCSNITLLDMPLTAARRNNCSVISVSTLRIRRPRFVGAVGTSPQAGIDFEPEENTTGYAVQDQHKDRLVDVLVEDAVGSGNASRDYFVNISNMNVAHQPVDITFRNCKSVRGTLTTPWGFNVRFLPAVFTTSPTGTIRFVNCSAEDLQYPALRLDWRLDCNVLLQFDGFKGVRCSRISTERLFDFNFVGNPTGQGIQFNECFALDSLDRATVNVVSAGGNATNVRGTIYCGDNSPLCTSALNSNSLASNLKFAAYRQRFKPNDRQRRRAKR